MRRCLRDPTFSRFDTIPECDGHTHTHTHTQTDTRRRHIPRLARRRAVKILNYNNETHALSYAFKSGDSERFKCDSTCFVIIMSIFNFCCFRTLAYTTLHKL